MQTFLPYPSFKQSAACLDRARLGKQRLEGVQILKVLLGFAPGSRWANHPAVRMWRGYEGALLVYVLDVCLEWKSRGYVDNQIQVLNELGEYIQVFKDPPWLGSPDFHISHQSNLLRKNPAWYAPHFPNIRNDLPYIWPVV